jgi:hypothetical protein
VKDFTQTNPVFEHWAGSSENQGRRLRNQWPFEVHHVPHPTPYIVGNRPGDSPSGGLPKLEVLPQQQHVESSDHGVGTDSLS